MGSAAPPRQTRRPRRGAGALPLVIVCVFLYLISIAAVFAIVCLPAWRQRAIALVALGSARLRARVRSPRRPAVQQGEVRDVRQAAHRIVGTSLAALQRHGLLALIVIGVLALAPVLAVALRHSHAYDGFDHTRSREVDAHLAALLQGEQLVPPLPLPPELFMTRDVEQAHPMAVSASRQWELLDADFRQRLLVVFKRMRELHGYEMVLIEGYRSPERQAQLAALGGQVTHAGAGQSYHQYGLAADSAFLRDGRVVVSEKDPWAARGYELFGALAESAGLAWGGSWRTLVDLGHVELTRPEVLQAARARAAQPPGR